jgi:asparagine synthase (glutamine-hydrolysing)
MSGIAGIVHFDGADVDGRLLRRMTDSMAVRGPERQQIWVDGAIGFGHALLDTNQDTTADHQPTSLDGQVWITADARIDDRQTLIRKLEVRENPHARSATDAQLILQAYNAWGEQCVDHLIGDFAFAIWDARVRRLFCARDQFGVKPFYYAELPGGMIFSNTLNCIRLHPAVGDALNEIAIGDFLLFGMNQDPATTTFASIRRLPAAQSLTCQAGMRRSRCYWTVPTDGRIRYRRPDEYVERFRELFRTAVDDRLRGRDADIWMSGGLDSTSIAATARRILFERDHRSKLRAHTIVYDRCIPDEERYYAGMAADALGIPISFFVADTYLPFDGWDRPDLHTPEPTGDPFLLMRRQQLATVASHGRVLLCGDGGDEVLWRSDVVDLLGNMRSLELGTDIARSLARYRRRPGIGIRDKLRKWRRPSEKSPAHPPWLNVDFARRIGPRVQYEHLISSQRMKSHRLRPQAYRRLISAPWGWCFESSDPGVTGMPVETRYPFLDRRIVEYLLAIPPIPWFLGKTLLRETMRGTLPEKVRHRPKTALPADPLRAHLKAASHLEWESLPPVAELARCVDRAAVPPMAGASDEDPWLNVRPHCLNYWLTRRRASTPS